MDLPEIHFLGSFPRLEDCPPPTLPEFAFIGRSNVGKSSLINMLTGRRKLARVSARPGKTQQLNFFEIGGKWRLVDLPGYGYAKASRTRRSNWERLIRHYLVRRSALAWVFLLVDGSIEPQKADLEFAAWMGGMQVPFAVVHTKTDKVGKAKRKALAASFDEALGERWEPLPERFPTSAKTKAGREELLARIGDVAAALGSRGAQREGDLPPDRTKTGD